MVEAPQLNTIEVGNVLSQSEADLINRLSLAAFNENAETEDIDEMKSALKTTQIKVITSTVDVEQQTTEALSLGDIATKFDQYVEKGEGWKLKVKEGTTDTPEWVKYIVENPKNNDLAYFVQKIAALVEYQTAKVYKEAQIEAEDVGVDKVFGNQTRRALIGLKNRIENDTTQQKITFLRKEKITDLITTNTKEGAIDQEALNTALITYHLIFDGNNSVKPIKGYEFVDPNSNNYAVRLFDDDVNSASDKSIDTGEKDDFGNTIVEIKTISQLPQEYKRQEKKVYDIIIDEVKYKFYGNGRVVIGDEKKYSKDVIAELNKKVEKDIVVEEKDIVTEEIDYDAIEGEMNEYVHTMNNDLSVIYFSDTKIYNIVGSSVIEKYKDSINIDIKNKSISYLGKATMFDKDISYKELFYLAAKSYKLINKRAASFGSFAYEYRTGLHFNYIKGSVPDMDVATVRENMPTIDKDPIQRTSWVNFLNDCQDVV